MNSLNTERTKLEEEGRIANSCEQYMFLFVIIDIFFLPYFSLVSVSFSVPIIMIWMVLNYRKLFRGREAYPFLFLTVFIVIGTIVSIVYAKELRNETAFSTTIKRGIQYFVCFGYYMYFKDYMKKYRVNIERYLTCFVLYVLIFVVLFLVMPEQYGAIKLMIHPADNHTRRYLANQVVYRFNYFWTDPNNIAYLMGGISFWFLLKKNVHIFKKMMIVTISALVILATASNGGILVLGAVVLWLFIAYFIHVSRGIVVRTNTIILLLFGIVALIGVCVVTGAFHYIQTQLIGKLLIRLSYYLQSSNISGGRMHDLSIAMQYVDPLMLVLGTGKEGFTTENGHLYWIGMYGLPSYLCFMYIMFAKFQNVKWRNYIWVFPFFVAFTMNIAIGEFKWLAIYFLMLADSRYMRNDRETLAVLYRMK